MKTNPTHSGTPASLCGPAGLNGFLPANIVRQASPRRPSRLRRTDTTARQAVSEYRSAPRQTPAFSQGNSRGPRSSEHINARADGREDLARSGHRDRLPTSTNQRRRRRPTGLARDLANPWHPIGNHPIIRHRACSPSRQWCRGLAISVPAPDSAILPLQKRPEVHRPKQPTVRVAVTLLTRGHRPIRWCNAPLRPAERLER